MSEWRASGKPMTQFVVGREYSLASLRYWAGRIKAEDHSGIERNSVPLAKLVRTDTSAPCSREELVVEVGRARVRVGAGFEPSVLRAVLQLLEQLGTGATP